MKWLQTKPSFQRTQGRDHYATAVAWDTGRRAFGDVNLIGPETPTDFHNDMKGYSLDRYMHGLHDIVIPYG